MGVSGDKYFFRSTLDYIAADPGFHMGKMKTSQQLGVFLPEKFSLWNVFFKLVIKDGWNSPGEMGFPPLQACLS